MTRVKECVLYRGFEHGDILDKMTALMDASERSAVNASEMEEEFYYDMPDAKERFSKSQIGFYAKYPDPKGDAFFNVGLNNPTTGEGVYYTIREENPVVSFLELLCSTNTPDSDSNY